MAAFGPPLGHPAAPSKRRPNFVQPLGSISPVPPIGGIVRSAGSPLLGQSPSPIQGVADYAVWPPEIHWSLHEPHSVLGCGSRGSIRTRVAFSLMRVWI